MAQAVHSKIKCNKERWSFISLTLKLSNKFHNLTKSTYLSILLTCSPPKMFFMPGNHRLLFILFATPATRFPIMWATDPPPWALAPPMGPRVRHTRHVTITLLAHIKLRTFVTRGFLIILLVQPGHQKWWSFHYSFNCTFKCGCGREKWQQSGTN